MRISIEWPDHLLREAKSHADLSGISLRDSFVSEAEERLARKKNRKSKTTAAGHR